MSESWRLKKSSNLKMFKFGCIILLQVLFHTMPDHRFDTFRGILNKKYLNSLVGQKDV